MAIPSSITDLSTTENSNSPAGSETIGSNLDNYLRAHATIIRTEYDKTANTIDPRGRLTLTSATPVTTSDVTGATTVYFTPHKGNVVALYDGTGWVLHTFTELSQATSDTTKSPAAVANNSNYDMFVWNDSGTLRCTRGPAWSSDTSRGTGAGTTELELFEGRYVNKVAITNGPAARRGLYVGTIRSDGSAQINDTAALRHVWNNYNRVSRPMRVIEGTDTWTYTTATIRQANGSTANQLAYVCGLAEDPVSARAMCTVRNSTASIQAVVGIGVDSTSTFSGERAFAANAANTESIAWGQYTGIPGLGYHYLSWNEYSLTSGTQTFVSDNGSTIIQAGISGEVRA